MRISTGMIYDNGVRSIQRQTSSLLHTQQQIASGRRILSPSEDPVAAAQALVLDQSKAINTQYGVTQDYAKNSLGLGDSQLSSASDLLVRVRELAVQAGNASLSASDRKSISTELRARFTELIGIANSTDGSGQYLFSGYQGTNKPFAGSVEQGVVYQGDEGQRGLRVSSSRNLPVSDSGNDIFMNIKNGNGIFVTGTQAEKSANAATATIDALTVTDATKWNDPLNSGNLELRFWVDRQGVGPLATAGSTYYDVVDKTTGMSLYAGTSSNTGAVAAGGTFTKAYTSGTPITLTGLAAAYTPPGDFGASVTVRGVPGDGDVFSLTRQASAVTINGSVNLPGPPSPLWNASSGNFELRFWKDSSNVLGGGIGKTYYDMVDMASGNSIYTGTPPVTGVGGSFTNAYTGGVPIDFSTAGTTPLDVSVTVTGAPADGDSFAVTQPGPNLIATAAVVSADQILSQSVKVTATQARATIDKGIVYDPVKWSSSTNPANRANSADLEVRFWVDVTGSVGSAGQTYYDLVDAASNKSLFTNAASTQGLGGSYTHAYTSGSAIAFSGLAAAYNPPSNDLGASVTVNGNPASGDTFKINSSKDPFGNGYFLAAPKRNTTVNTGSGIVGTGEVLDAAKWNSASNSGKLEVRFWKDVSSNPASTYYDLVDASTEKSLFTDTASTIGGTANTFTHKFTSGDSISFSGLAAAYGDFGASVTINGTPATGDVFTLDKSTSESIFSTLARLINGLESPVGTGSNGNTALHNTLGQVFANLSQATDSILAVRADIGSRLSEIDSLNGVVTDMNLQYATTLSNLQDVDYAQAITDMTRNQVELEAAQKSFVNISKLSLFNYV